MRDFNPPYVRYGSNSTAGSAARGRGMSASPGGLNGSTQHSILKGKDGVFGNASRLFSRLYALGQKIEAIGGIVPARHSLVGRCAATGLMQQRIADLAISVLGCCELHSQKQAQLKVGAFQPQPSGYKN